MVSHAKKLMAVPVLFHITNDKMANSENILNSIKNAVYRIWLFFLLLFSQYYRVVIFLALSGYLADRCVGVARGGTIEIKNRGPPDLTAGSVYIQKISGATENYDFGKDFSYLHGPSPTLQIYAVNNNCDPNKLSTEAKDINSTTDDNLELVNNGFSGFRTNILTPIIRDSNDLEWKNIFLGDVNNSENIVTDIKYVVYSSGKFINDCPYGEITLGTLEGTQTGVYDKRKIMFFNHADLNRDRKVNNLDFAVWSNEFGKNTTTDPNRFGTKVGSDPNDLGAYADIDKSGTVDYNDLSLFSTKWLWDANDPNTW